MATEIKQVCPTDLAVYVSSTSKEPSAKRCDRYYINASEFTHHFQGCGEYVYFTLSSTGGCHV